MGASGSRFGLRAAAVVRQEVIRLVRLDLRIGRAGGRCGNHREPVVREHLARRGLGLHNDLQNESSIVGNNVGLLLMLHHGSE